MARLSKKRTPTHRHAIAIIDDDPSVVRSMSRLLASEGHEVMSAMTPGDGVRLVRDNQPHLVLLDYHMPGGTGADVVAQIRKFDSYVQVLLVTGYASEQPARKLLAELDIQGYHDKTDGPQRLLVLIDAALKHYRTLSRIQRQKAALRHILDATPEILRLQSERQLLHCALGNLGPLLAGGDGFVATANNGLFVFDEAHEGISIHAATGQYATATGLSALPSALNAVVRQGIEREVPFWHAAGYVVVPLETREGDRGCMVIEAPTLPMDAIEACQIYGKLVVQALENVILFERATVDPLTRLYNRGFGRQRLEETLRLATRTNDETSVMLLDLDHFKAINDGYGHAAGDLTLHAVATALRQTCRTTDVIARYGGEEFVVILPATDAGGARILAERVRSAIAGLTIHFDEHEIRVTASSGIATADSSEVSPAKLLRRADEALYRAKHAGRNRVESAGDDGRAGAREVA